MNRKDAYYPELARAIDELQRLLEELGLWHPRRPQLVLVRGGKDV